MPTAPKKQLRASADFLAAERWRQGYPHRSTNAAGFHLS
jgi:hypothetical protein